MNLTSQDITFFINTYIKMFFLLAPFFCLSIFLKMADGLEPQQRRQAAVRASVAILIAITVFFFFGKPLFSILGITLPAFQVGAGTTLFLTSVMLVLGISKPPAAHDDEDFAIVPLALPIIVGPGTIGTLMIWATEMTSFEQKTIAYAAIFSAGVTMSLFLLTAEHIRRFLGARIMAVMIKVTALVLTALAAQIILTGIKSFLFNN